MKNKFVEMIKEKNPKRINLIEQIFEGAEDIEEEDEKYILAYSDIPEEERWGKIETPDINIEQNKTNSRCCDFCDKQSVSFCSTLMSDVQICKECRFCENLQTYETELFGNLKALIDADRYVEIEYLISKRKK